MRWLFLIMVALNLAYIGWELSDSDNLVQSKSTASSRPGAETIILLSELDKQPDIHPAQEKSDGLTDKSDNKVLAESGSGHQKSGSHPQKSEVSKPSAEPEEATGEEIPVKTPKKTTTQACFTLGPFRDLEKLRAVTRDIKKYVSETDFRGIEEKEQTIFWVYIKPADSRKLAIRTGNQLKKKKIKDFYIIRDGAKLNGVSLGHFRNRHGAYSLAEKVRKLGFDVTVEPIFKTYTLYWLDYRLAPESTIPAELEAQYLTKKIRRLARACDSGFPENSQN